ncbi:MAG TPA: MFS transporter [Herbaspirillum sp.]|jgi:AAHS family 4-hydroxybenzoate transporter-like MFS transporter
MQTEYGALDTEEIVDKAPIGKLQILTFLLGTGVIFIDGFNIQVMGYITPQLARIWDIPHELLGSIFSSGLFGVFTGYLVLSPFANRFGHRRMLIWCTALIGVGTLATSMAGNIYSLMALRYLTGIALGASNPSAVLIISDFCPKRVRSSFVAASIVGVSLGSMVAGLVSAALLDGYGWQAVLWVGALVPLILAVVLAALVPNTFDYLLNRKRDQLGALQMARRVDPAVGIPDGTQFTTGTSGQSGSVAELFKSGRTVGTVAIWVSFSCNLLVFFFIQSWLTMIVVQSGHSQKIAVTATSMLMFGGVLAFLAIGPLMDRFSPYKVLSVYFFIASGTVALLGSLLSGSVPLIMASAFLVGFVVLGLQKGMNAICVYYYPTAMRSTGLGWGLGIGRLGAVAGPLVAGFLLDMHMPTARLFYWAALPMLIACAAQFIMSRTYGERDMHAEQQARIRA